MWSRLLAGHPGVQVTAITSRAEAGVKVADYFPSLRRRYDLAFSDPATAPLKGCDCVFFATPNGVAMSQARALLESGAKIVDFSADFRLKDRATWEKWYKVTHASPELFGEAVYGLPEINRERIRKARLVANPHIELRISTHGGHCGFVEPSSVEDDGYWAERQIVDFVRRHASGASESHQESIPAHHG